MTIERDRKTESKRYIDKGKYIERVMDEERARKRNVKGIERGREREIKKDRKRLGNREI